jgi:hypothetical protein
MSIFALGMCSAEEGSGNRSAALLGQGGSPAADSWTGFRIVRSTIRISKRCPDHLGIFAAGASSATRMAVGLKQAAMDRASRLIVKLMHHAVITVRHGRCESGWLVAMRNVFCETCRLVAIRATFIWSKLADMPLSVLTADLATWPTTMCSNRFPSIRCGPRGQDILIGMKNLGEGSFMDQHLRQVCVVESCEVTDLFAANAKCHIYCVFCVDDSDNRKGSTPVKRCSNGSVTIIVFYGIRLKDSRSACRIAGIRSRDRQASMRQSFRQIGGRPEYAADT